VRAKITKLQSASDVSGVVATNTQVLSARNAFGAAATNTQVLSVIQNPKIKLVDKNISLPRLF
jgi:hypothetical protein